MTSMTSQKPARKTRKKKNASAQDRVAIEFLGIDLSIPQKFFAGSKLFTLLGGTIVLLRHIYNHVGLVGLRPR